MNVDFSELFSKFSDILKEKDIDLNNIVEHTKPETNSNTSDFSLDINTILKLKDILAKIRQNQDCPRNNLLYSLKPYLELEKREKLDQYIKIASLLSAMESLDLGINFLNENKKGYDFILIITLLLLII